jgi:hypothetical protein
MTYTKTPYDTDFVQWLDHTAKLLKQRRFDELELENLIEEIEALNRSEKREIKSHLEVLLLYLLKWHYQPGHRSRSWQSTIREQRRQILRLLKDSPSLKNHVSNELKDSYAIARERADEESIVFLQNFPEQCPYQITDILNPDFFP